MRCVVAPLRAATTEKAPQASLTQIKQWIGDLSSNDYTVREAASAQLVRCGTAVLDELAAHHRALKAAGADAELLWRTVHIVQQIAVSGDIDLLDRSIDILEGLRKAAPHRTAILGPGSSNLRERFRIHAQQQITELGGVISGSHLGGGLGVDLGSNFKGDSKHLRYLKVLGSITYLRLHGEKFGNDCVEHLKGLSDLQQLHLMETAVTSAGQTSIEKEIDGIKVLRFGPAVIGIAGVTHSGHCLIQGVQPGTGAEKGGLRPGDMVTKLDGTEIKSFEDLVGVIAEKQVDQQVKVEVVRAGKASEHLVTLTRRPATNPQIVPSPYGLPPGVIIPRR
ncbi:MAG: PDZ domain-containing protein [Pirellulales bacterium]|nr:PDZ domain-containing protein [Pirellulales bacterium]